MIAKVVITLPYNTSVKGTGQVFDAGQVIELPIEMTEVTFDVRPIMLSLQDNEFKQHEIDSVLEATHEAINRVSLMKALGEISELKVENYRDDREEFAKFDDDRR
jgi:hypothetical protein